MTEKKCPMCDGSCLLKVITTEDSRLCEVDACSMCGTMYPRDKKPGRGEEKPEDKD
ncbi:TPA: hypothetical protein HA259_01535 [Thermoplasmata archaeon]|nr:hypothetical protein [Thermoplasmata archaeon]